MFMMCAIMTEPFIKLNLFTARPSNAMPHGPAYKQAKKSAL